MLLRQKNIKKKQENIAKNKIIKKGAKNQRLEESFF